MPGEKAVAYEVHDKDVNNIWVQQLDGSAGRQITIALAFIGDSSRKQAPVEKLADDLAEHFPEDTVVQFNYLPTIHAQLEISRRDIDALQTAAPYEFGSPTLGPSAFYIPFYVRGQADIAAHQSSEAVNCKNPRPSRDRAERTDPSTGASPTGSRLRSLWRYRQGPRRLSRFSHPLERRRSRHPILKQAKVE